MPSERRLHPWSVVFTLGAQVRQLAVPILLALFAGSRSGNWGAWTLVILVPSALAAIVRYVAFRYEFGATELIIRSGLIFQNERHIPYARIQNLDAVQNALHRLLGVVDVRVDTGTAGGDEAHLRVITWSAYAEVRDRVLAARGGPEGTGAATPLVAGDTASVAAGGPDAASPPAAARADRGDVLLALTPSDLALHGLIENRAMVILSAALGGLWETGILEQSVERFIGGDAAIRDAIRDVVVGIVRDGVVPWDRLLLVASVVAGVLIVARLLSVAWAVVRLYGYQVRLVGADLRTEYGLLTRVSATIPLHRIQTLTVSRGLLHHAFGRASVRVETAGGQTPGERGASAREALAPILRVNELPRLIGRALPGLDVAAPDWQPPAPRAGRRAFVRRAVVATVPVATGVALAGWRAAWALPVVLAWAALAARVYVAHQRWARVEGGVLFRTGWIWSHETIARVTKIQAVEMLESPFDRRFAMARVRVDTAGAGQGSHHIDIPYLARPAAVALTDDLAAGAAATAFRW
ncbi:MAG: PH domain-containing protein [Vicinamibacterales bacterium]